MVSMFVEVILPVFLIFGAGFIGQKRMNLDIKSVSSVALYFMMPALVFRTFFTIELNLEYLYIVIFSLLLLFAIIFIVMITSKVFKLSGATESGLILSTAFMNSGNYGTPVILFAFGEKGFVYSISFIVLQSIIMHSFGVYFAARGKSGIKVAIKTIFKIPAIYAFALAMIWKGFNIPMADSFFKAIDLVAGATIPTVMLVLGMQLAQIKLDQFEWNKMSYAIILRLIASPLIAWIITLWLPIDPLLKKVLIVSAAMPTAATTTMYALQFDSEPKFVSSVTLLTTILSAATLSVLLYFI